MANEIINTIWKTSLHIYTDGSEDTEINVAGCSMFALKQEVQPNNVQQHQQQPHKFLEKYRWLQIYFT